MNIKATEILPILNSLLDIYNGLLEKDPSYVIRVI